LQNYARMLHYSKLTQTNVLVCQKVFQIVNETNKKKQKKNFDFVLKLFNNLSVVCCRSTTHTYQLSIKWLRVCFWLLLLSVLSVFDLSLQEKRVGGAPMWAPSSSTISVEVGGRRPSPSVVVRTLHVAALFASHTPGAFLI